MRNLSKSMNILIIFRLNFREFLFVDQIEPYLIELIMLIMKGFILMFERLELIILFL